MITIMTIMIIRIMIIIMPLLEFVGIVSRADDNLRNLLRSAR